MDNGAAPPPAPGAAEAGAAADAGGGAPAADETPDSQSAPRRRVDWDYCLVWRALVQPGDVGAAKPVKVEATGRNHKAQFVQSMQIHAAKVVQSHLTKHALEAGLALFSSAVGEDVSRASHGNTQKRGAQSRLSRRRKAQLEKLSADERLVAEEARARGLLTHFQRQHTLARVKRRVLRSGLHWRQFASTDGQYIIVQIGATEERLVQAAATQRIALIACPKSLQNVALDRIGMLLSNKTEQESSAFWRYICKAKDVFLSLGLHQTGYVLPGDLDGDGIDDAVDDDIAEEEGELAIGLGIDAAVPRTVAIRSRFSASDYIFLPMSLGAATTSGVGGSVSAPVRGKDIACVYDMYAPPVLPGANLRALAWAGCAGGEGDAESRFYADLDSDDDSDGADDGSYEAADTVFFEKRFGEAGGAALHSAVEHADAAAGDGSGAGGGALEVCVPDAGGGADRRSSGLQRKKSFVARGASSREEAMANALAEARAAKTESKRTATAARRAEAIAKAIAEAKASVIVSKTALKEAVNADLARLDHEPNDADEEQLKYLTEKRDADVVALGELLALQRREERRSRGAAELSERDEKRWRRARKRRQALAVHTRFRHTDRVRLVRCILKSPRFVLEGDGSVNEALSKIVLPGCALDVDLMEQLGAVAAAFPLHDTNYRSRLEAQWVYQSKRWPWAQPLEAQYRAVWRDGCGPNRDFEALPAIVDLGGGCGGANTASAVDSEGAAGATAVGAVEAEGEDDASSGADAAAPAAAAADAVATEGGDASAGKIEGDAGVTDAGVVTDDERRLNSEDMLRAQLLRVHSTFFVVGDAVDVRVATDPERWREGTVVAAACERSVDGALGSMRYDVAVRARDEVRGDDSDQSETLVGLGADLVRRQQQQWTWEFVAPGIKDYYGEKIALYFAWISFYTFSLVPLSIIGAIVFVARILSRGFIQLGSLCAYVDGCDAEDYYSLYPMWGAGVFIGVQTDAPTAAPAANATAASGEAADLGLPTAGPGLGVVDLLFVAVVIAWMTVTIEGWKRIEFYLAKRWGTRGSIASQEDRLEYTGESVWKFGVNLEDVRFPFGGGGAQAIDADDGVPDPPLLSELALFRSDEELRVISTRIFPSDQRLPKQEYYRPMTRVRVLEANQDPVAFRARSGARMEPRYYLAEVVEVHTLNEDGARSSYDPQEAKRKALSERKSAGKSSGGEMKKKEKATQLNTDQAAEGAAVTVEVVADGADAAEPSKEGAEDPAAAEDAPAAPAATAEDAAPLSTGTADTTSTEGATAVAVAAAPATDFAPERDGLTYFTYDVRRIPRGKQASAPRRALCGKRDDDVGEGLAGALQTVTANDETMLVEARNRLDRWGRNAWFLARVHMVLTPYEMEVVKTAREERAKSSLLLERREGRALAKLLDVTLPRKSGRGGIATRADVAQFAPSVKQIENAASHAKKEADRTAKEAAKTRAKKQAARAKAIAKGPQKFASSHDDPMVAMQTAKRKERERLARQKQAAQQKRELLLTMRDQVDMIHDTVEEEAESGVPGAVGFVQIAEENWAPQNMNEQEMGEWHRFIVTFANADKKQGSGRVAVQYDGESDPIEFFLSPLLSNGGKGDPLRAGATPEQIAGAEGIATHAQSTDSFRWRIASYGGWKVQLEKDAAALAFDQRLAEEAEHGGAAGVPPYGARRAAKIGAVVEEPEPEPELGETTVTIKAPPPKPKPWTLPDKFVTTEAKEWGFLNHERLVVEFIECPSAATGLPRVPDKLRSWWVRYIPPFTLVLLVVFCVVAMVGVTLFKIYVALFPGGFVAAFVLNAVTIIVLSHVYDWIADWLIDFENHRTQSSHDNSVIINFCTFQFANSYNALLYIAFFKRIPVWGNSEGLSCVHDDCIEELELQLAIILLLRLTLSNASEVITPVVKAMSMSMRNLSDRVGAWWTARRESKEEALRERLANERGPIDDLRDGLAATSYRHMLGALRERAARSAGSGKKKKKKKRDGSGDDKAAGADADGDAGAAKGAAAPAPRSISCDDFVDAILVLSGAMAMPKVNRGLVRFFLQDVFEHIDVREAGHVQFASVISALRFIYRHPYRHLLTKASKQERFAEIEDEYRGVFEVVADVNGDGCASYSELHAYFSVLNATATTSAAVLSEDELAAEALAAVEEKKSQKSKDGGARSTTKEKKKKKKKKKKQKGDAVDPVADAALAALARTCALDVLRKHGGVISLGGGGGGESKEGAAEEEAPPSLSDEARAAKLAAAVALPDSDVEGWVLTEAQFVECFATLEFEEELATAESVRMEIEGDGDDDADNPLLSVGSSGSAALLAVEQAQLDDVRARFFDGSISSDADLHDALRDIGLPKQDAMSASVRIRAARRAERVEIEDQFTKPEYDPSEDTLEDYGEMVVNYGYITLFAAAFPLAPLLGLLSAIVEARIDAFKISRLHRRPEPIAAENVGEWAKVMRWLTYIAMVSNLMLIFFTGQLRIDTVAEWVRSAFDLGQTSSDETIFAMGRTASQLLIAAIAFVFSEHILLGISFAIDAAIDDEPADVALQAERQIFLQEVIALPDESVLEKSAHRSRRKAVMS